MAINWYPGHMHKANKAMHEVLPQVDLVIELLDCRLPFSSQNPSIAKLAKNKPCIKVLSKSDLADAELTGQWQAYFEKNDQVKTLLTTLDESDKAHRLLQLCRKLAPKKAKAGFSIMAMITGIPNVGKSTLINATANRKIAKTGDEPAITKGLQKIKINDNLVFLDTPGILWPKINNQNSAYRLAATGAIKDTAIELEDIAFYLAEFLLKKYPGRLVDRYQLTDTPSSEVEFLELLGARRGCLRTGGQVDFAKASTILLNEFRAGMLGNITLETPAMITEEEILVQKELEAKAQREKMKKEKKHNSRKS